jgi:hypothetical protein
VHGDFVHGRMSSGAYVHIVECLGDVMCTALLVTLGVWGSSGGGMCFADSEQSCVFSRLAPVFKSNSWLWLRVAAVCVIPTRIV